MIQVWKADEFYFFRVKPMPGVSIIDVIGQMRIEEDCSMYFANDNHVMVSLNKERILTFDREGYVIEKKDFALYQQPHKILLESQIFEGRKFIAIENKDGHITMIAESSDENGLPEVIQEPFDLLDLERELQQLNSRSLETILGLKNLESFPDVSSTIKIH